MFFSSHQPISVADIGRSVNHVKPLISLFTKYSFLNFASAQSIPPPTLLECNNICGSLETVLIVSQGSNDHPDQHNTKVSRHHGGIFSLWWTSKIITLSPLSPLASC